LKKKGSRVRATIGRVGMTKTSRTSREARRADQSEREYIRKVQHHEVCDILYTGQIGEVREYRSFIRNRHSEMSARPSHP